MTLIAGVKCIDGFLIAADTAHSIGDVMYHGQKIDLYRGCEYRMVIACAGDLSCAQTAARQIHLALQMTADLDIPRIVDCIEDELLNVYENHIYPRINVSADAPDFSLIIGIECHGLCEILKTNQTRVTSGKPYVFDGGGHDLAFTYADLLLRSRQNDVLSLFTAPALHIVDEIFRVVKRFRAGVGLDTRIFAWRSADSRNPFFELGNDQRDFFWAIQENLKWATWAALDPTESETLFDGVKNQPRLFLEGLREFTKKVEKLDAQFIRYSSLPQAKESRMQNLD